MKDILKTDLKTAMLERDFAKRDAIRIILGEMSRDRNKDLDNMKIVSIIKKLIKDEKESHNDLMFINICRDYIPVEVSEKAIEKWIKENIDFSQYRNKMQAMKPVMEYFKGQADGNVVKAIIQKGY